LFDYLLLHRIDSIPLLIHQGSYLILLTGLLALDHRYFVAGKDPEGLWGKILSFRHWVIHFFLGTLLNAFMIFYFKASSGFFSFLFILGLAVMIVINELPRFRALGPVLRVGLLSFSISSYLAYLLPVVTGYLSSWQYFLAIAVGCGMTVGLWKMFRRFTHDPNWTFRRAVAPGLIVQGTLLLLYLAQVVPPVPLSLKYIGIFHDVKRAPAGEQRGAYQLSYVEPPSMWPHIRIFEFPGNVIFARRGDNAWAFIRLFAPRHFSDRVGFAWAYHDPKQGWVDIGAPFFLELRDGGEHGWPTFAYQAVAKAGEYRVRIVTADGREIGRKTFEVIADPSTEDRTFDTLYK
jgi:hypothetical protein